MFQTIDGVDVYVVHISVPPQDLLPITFADTPSLELYARALDTAIRTGVISEPGKYGINVTDSGQNYNVFRILE